METFSVKGISLCSSRLICGTWAFSSDYWENQDDKDSRAVLRIAAKTGINHFDAAFSYGHGKSEQLTGQFFHKTRDSIILSTKDLPGPAFKLEKNFRKSLSRLLTDYVDLYYIHWPVPGTDWKEVCKWIDEKKHAGLIKASGLSNITAEDYRLVSGVTEISAVQNGFNLLFTGGQEDLVSACQRNGCAFIAYSPLAQGLLSGRYLEPSDFSPTDRRRKLIFFYPEVFPSFRKAILALREISASFRISLPVLSIGWALSRHRVCAVCIGARNRVQAQELFAADYSSLPEQALSQADDATSDLRLLTGKFPNIFNHKF